MKQENKKLISNFISLSVLQLSSLVLSIIVLPYLVIILGVEKFGLVIYAQAVMTYFTVFTDYGFNLSATRDISINSNNSKKINEIFNNVLFSKILLGIFCFLLLIFVSLTFPKLGNESFLFYSSFAIVGGQIIFPIWFFQGIEQMKFITYLNLIAKIIFTCLTFLLIKSSSDYIYVNLFLGTGNIISGIISLLFLKLRFNIRLKLPNIKQITYELQNGWHILLSSLSINIYLNSNIIILGIFVNSTIVGYYSIAEKAMMMIRLPLSVFSQVIYPHICKLVMESHKKLLHFYKKVFIPFLIAIILSCLALFIFSDNIVFFLAKKNVLEISDLIKIISFIPIIVCLNIPAYQTLLAYNQKKSYSFVFVLGSILSLGSNTILSAIFGAKGTCISIFITEFAITCGLYLILEIRNIEFSLLRY